jgi:hypothetical protein
MATKRPFGDNRGDYIPFGISMPPKTTIWSFILLRVGTGNLAGDWIESLSCLANRFLKKSNARLVLSEKLQFPSIGHTRCTTML